MERRPTATTEERMRKKECYRCHKFKPLAEFYRRADKTIIGGCRSCHKELSAQRRLVEAKQLTLPALASARIVTAPSAAPLAVWTCEACRTRRTTVLEAFPTGWRKLGDLVPGAPVVLCGPCGTKALRGMRVLRAVLTARVSPSRTKTASRAGSPADSTVLPPSHGLH
jgi:hypothetical protein